MKVRRRVAAAILVVLNLAALYFVGISWLVTPDGPWDDDVLAGLTAAALIGAALAVPTTLLTVVPVLLRWLRAWWFAVPAILFILAVARVIYLGAAYPEPPDRYGLP